MGKIIDGSWSVVVQSAFLSLAAKSGARIRASQERVRKD